ncbi:MAG: hypothetical protein Q8K52_02940 [Thiobacillus sp.]|nr:hypothetical protein [Thiobacillus sp.]
MALSIMAKHIKDPRILSPVALSENIIIRRVYLAQKAFLKTRLNCFKSDPRCYGILGFIEMAGQED